jgi:hypothetical protein
MAELLDLITNVSLLLIGLLLGALLTYEFSVRLDKKQKENRKLGVASTLYYDIVSRLVAALDIRYGLEGLEKVLVLSPKEVWGKFIESIESYKSAFNRDTLTAFLPELPLLPEETVVSILAYYNYSEIRLGLIWRYLERQDSSSLKNAADLCEEVFRTGEDVLVSLTMVVQGVEMKEAQRLASQMMENIRTKLRARAEIRSP